MGGLRVDGGRYVEGGGLVGGGVRLVLGGK